MRRAFGSPWSLRCLLGAMVLHVATASPTRAQETRRFEITVDGRKAGTYQLTYRDEADGLTVTQKAKVRVTVLAVFSYSYSFDGAERWQGDRLMQWDASANDDGTRYTVRGRREDDGFRVTVNGKERTIPAGFCLTTYARQPAGKLNEHKQPLVDTDTGKELQSIATDLGAEERTVAGNRQPCTHVRLRGGVHVDLWYDAQGRLVHQESLESGYRTVMRLVEMER